MSLPAKTNVLNDLDYQREGRTAGPSASVPPRESCNASPSLPLTLASSTLSLRRAQRSRPTSAHGALKSISQKTSV